MDVVGRAGWVLGFEILFYFRRSLTSSLAIYLFIMAGDARAIQYHQAWHKTLSRVLLATAFLILLMTIAHALGIGNTVAM